MPHDTTKLLWDMREAARRITDHRKIAGFRNALIHGYDAIDDAVTWSVIQNKLPVLCRELDTLMR